MRHLLLIAIGGSVGSVARHFTYIATTAVLGSSFVWGTFIVNIIGCFAIGMFYQLLDHTIHPGAVSSFFIIGFLGAYTTFSTFSLENFHLLKGEHFKMLAFNILSSTLLGIAAVWIGIKFIQMLTR